MPLKQANDVVQCSYKIEEMMVGSGEHINVECSPCAARLLSEVNFKTLHYTGVNYLHTVNRIKD